ncbi:MAG: hypothetical protein Q9217_006043 [Psora testacea]
MVDSLADLPIEVLSQIICYVVTVKDLSHLALTCKKLYSLVAEDGYRIFIRSRFPSIYISPPAAGQRKSETLFWRDAAHSLTTLSRNWDRKAFIAQSISPSGDISNPVMENRQRYRGRRSMPVQTMGYTPVIDSHEAWTASEWSSRKQIVVWGAGPDLVMGSRKLPESLESRPNPYLWAVYLEPCARAGRDDITYVQSLHGEASERSHVMVGRANGDLARIAMALNGGTGGHERLVTFHTGGRPVRSANVNSDDILAACLSDNTLALYTLNMHSAIIDPMEDLNMVLSPKPAKVWSTHFLRHDRLAVGYGPASDPIKIYDLGRGSLTERESITKSIWVSKRKEESNLTARTSIISLAPLPTSNPAGGQEGDLFLSGAYDGVVRLHDLRCANIVAGTFQDPVDFSSIYSLLPFGRERFVAGGALHALIKVFDLRMPGERMYYAIDARTCGHEPKGWNVFLGKRCVSNTRSSRNIESPVYSLSKPSECSPTFFAGIEGRVLKVDLVSIMDKHPDPVYGGMPSTGYRANDIHRKWNPLDRILSLPMYEHNDGPVKLRVQREVGLYKGTFHGWDERWTGA